jgi:hypothetical protein
MRSQKLIFLFSFIIFSFLFSRVAFADESFVNITSSVTFSNPSVGNVCGWYPDFFNSSNIYGIEMYNDTFPGTANLVVTGGGHYSNSGLSSCSGGQLEKGFWNGAINTPDGNYWVKMTSTGSPYSPDWANSTSYYFEARRIEGVWSLVFTPPAESDPVNIPCTENCFSNVLFLPGLMGSRLYGSDENELWFSGSDSDHTNLLLDNQGKSIDTNVYTKNETGVIDEIFGLNIYKSFVNELKDWKEEGTIMDYSLVPYDWRLSLEDIITNGNRDSENVSYTTSQDFSKSFILKKLEELQKSSKSGKVTIITHSNGGLVAKALVQKLKDTNNPLYEKIDKIIFVAVPQIGTPDAVLALLHGTELGPYGFIMEKDRARELSENMPTVYNLLPSASYFDTIDPAFASDKLISFENTTFFDPKTSKYGVFISNETELEDYILGNDGRSKPSFSDTKNPNIGNSVLYENAKQVHELLDEWEPHTDTKVIQVAGWGAETISGLDYKVYRDTSERISYKPRFTIDGDSTVVVPSALWMPESSNVEKWWVNLIKYNGFFSLNLSREHRDILEISNLINFIKAKITDSDFSDSENVVVGNTSTLVSSDSRRLHFILHSPLTLGIIDSEGNYTGMDPDTREVKEEIPGVDYRQIGEVQSLSVPAGAAYTLKLQGYDDGYFSLDVEEQIGNEVTNATLFEGILSSTSTLAMMDITPDFEASTSELKVDTNGDEIVDQVYPIVEVETPPIEVDTTEENSVETSGSLFGSNKIDVAELSAKIDKEPTEPQVENENLDMVEVLGENTEVEKTTEENQKKEDIEEDENLPLSASAIDSSFTSNWVLYVIILGILVILFLIKRFIKI